MKKRIISVVIISAIFFSLLSLSTFAINKTGTYNGLKYIIATQYLNDKPIGDRAIIDGCENHSMKTIVIPASIEGYHVNRINDAAFFECDSVTTVVIPNSVQEIDYNAFGSCSQLKDVYFSGTKAEWESIEVGAGNWPLLHASLHFSTKDGIPVSEDLLRVQFKESVSLYYDLFLTQDVDRNDSIPTSEYFGAYYRVKQADSLEGLRTYCRQYYTEEIVSSLTDGTNLKWKEQNGKLYVSQAYGLGGPSVDSVDMIVHKDSASHYTIDCHCYWDAGFEDDITVHLIQVNGYWVWDEIIPGWNGITVNKIVFDQLTTGDGIPTFHAMVLNGATGDDEHGTDNAAALMYTSLCKNQLANYVVENQNIHPFAYNNTTNPTSEETVNKWISHSFSSSDDDDLSVFYYTGHSTWDGNTSIHFGITLGNGEWYRWSSLAQYLAEHVKGQIIVILDTCFSETFTTVGINSLEQKDKDRFSVITSCAYDEKSSIRNVTLFHELNYPCFSYSIGEGIGFVDDKWHADVNSDGKVTLEELYNYVSKKVRSYNDDMHVTLLTNHKEQVVFQKAIKRISFSDVDNQAYYWDAVSWAVNKGITNGTSDTTFSPNQPCTRAQVVTFLWRANGSPKMTGGNPFKDVTTSAYYYDAVQWAAKNGITAGTSATTFSPNQACTRAQVVTFLWRAHGQPVSNMKNPFLDVKKGQFYYDAVLWAVSNDVTKGTSQTLFSPDQTCTRGQIVTFLYRDLG